MISFYGGEPLLEMKLIHEIIAYANKVFKGKNIRYNMTTNATLLNDEIVKFLYENDISITISLMDHKLFRIIVVSLLKVVKVLLM